MREKGCVMSNDMVRPDEFGKDHGLIHEAVVTGRRVGAGARFWGRLAHDAGFFGQVVAHEQGQALPDIDRGLLDLIPTPAAQVANVALWQELLPAKKRFSKGEVNSLPPAPASPVGNMPCVLLVPYLDSLEATVELYTRLIAVLYPSFWQRLELKFDPKHLRLWQPTGSSTDWLGRKLAWVSLDLLAYRDPVNRQKVEKSRATEGKPMPGVEILALACHAPALVQTMNGASMPYLDLPGLEANIESESVWSRAPYLLWDGGPRQVDLGARRVSSAHGFFASPAFRECRS